MRKINFFAKAAFCISAFMGVSILLFTPLFWFSTILYFAKGVSISEVIFTILSFFILTVLVALCFIFSLRLYKGKPIKNNLISYIFIILGIGYLLFMLVIGLDFRAVIRDIDVVVTDLDSALTLFALNILFLALGSLYQKYIDNDLGITSVE